MFSSLISLSSAKITEHWTLGVNETHGFYADTDSLPCTCNTGLTSSVKAIKWWFDRINVSYLKPGRDQHIMTHNASWIFANVFFNAFQEYKLQGFRALKWFLGKEEANYEQQTFFGGYYQDIPNITSLVQKIEIPENIEPTQVPQFTSKKIIEALDSNKTVIIISDTPHHFNLWGVEYDSDKELITKAYLTDSSMTFGTPTNISCHNVSLYKFSYERNTYLFIKQTPYQYGAFRGIVTLDPKIQPLLNIDEMRDNLVKRVETYKSVSQDTVGSIPVEKLNEIEKDVKNIKTIDDFEKCQTKIADAPTELTDGYYRLISADESKNNSAFYIKYTENISQYTYNYAVHDDERLEEIFHINSLEPWAPHNIVPKRYVHTAFLFSPNTGKYPYYTEKNQIYPPVTSFPSYRTTFGITEFANFHVGRSAIVYDIMQPSSTEDRIVLWDSGNSPYTTSIATKWHIVKAKNFKVSFEANKWVTKTFPFPVKIPEKIAAYYVPKNELAAKIIPAGTVIPVNFSIIVIKNFEESVDFEISSETPNEEYTTENNRLTPVLYVCSETPSLGERYEIVSNDKKINFAKVSTKQNSNTASLFVEGSHAKNIEIPYDVAPPFSEDSEEGNVTNGMGAGTISGIAIGSVLLIAVIVGIIFFVKNKKKEENKAVSNETLLN